MDTRGRTERKGAGERGEEEGGRRSSPVLLTKIFSESIERFARQ